jgi:hypothetical protein
VRESSSTQGVKCSDARPRVRSGDQKGLSRQTAAAARGGTLSDADTVRSAVSGRASYQDGSTKKNPRAAGVSERPGVDGFWVKI